MICGIDEAGRGPVIGPLVIAGLCISPGQEENLQRIGVRDSKFLSPKKREEIYSRLIDNYPNRIIMISPKEVDASLNGEGTNLNWLEADHSARIITELSPKKVILDCPSANILSYTLYVKKKVPASIELVVEHKADANHLVVGAASILAKVTRDREIERLKRVAGVDFGSGYPSDPKTVKFLKENWKKYDFFRKSWSSYKKVASDQSSLRSF